MKFLRNVMSFIDHQTVIITALALVSTYVCLRQGWSANMPSGLIGVAIIFPIVFSINAAYRRREEALRYFASVKGHAMGLFLAHRDWLPKDNPELKAQGRALVEELFAGLDAYFQSSAEKEKNELENMYDIFSRISRSHEDLRRADVPANEISRANQYLKAIMVDLERMRNIRLYRTPTSLRAYSQLFLNVFPILFGPFFAFLAIKYYVAVGYAVAVMYSLVLVSLDNIQEDLEDPYDGIGVDDVQLSVLSDYKGFLEK